eukprot:6474085-Amphidinium_carterae.1
MPKSGTGKASLASKRSAQPDGAEPKRKFPKLQPVGNCECLLCKSKSQALGQRASSSIVGVRCCLFQVLHPNAEPFLTLPTHYEQHFPEDGVPWAVHQQKGEQSIPFGDQCLSCYELNKACFPHLTWEEMCASSDENFKGQLSEARQAKAAHKPLQPPQYVQQEMHVGVELEKTFHVASEKTLRQLSGLARLPKAQLKKLPSFKVSGVASSTGEEETLYLFKDGSDDGIRKAKLKIFVGANHLIEQMSASNCYYGEQGENVQQHVLNQSSACKTLLDSINKDGSLYDVSQFVSDHLSKGQLGDEEGDDVVVADEEIAQLVGPGASQYVPAPASTTAAKAKAKPNIASPCIQRSLSKTSMAGDGASAAASTYGGMCDGSTVDGDLEEEDDVGRGGRLTQWKNRLPLATCMVKMDNRTVDACRKAYERLLPIDRGEALQLQNYYKLVQKAVSLQPERLSSLSASEKKIALEAMISESVEFPTKLKVCLVESRIDDLKEAKAYKELLHCISPFKDADAFNPFNPNLAAAEPDVKKRVFKFNKIVFKDLYTDLLSAAEEKCAQILQLTEQCLHEFGAIQLEEVEDTAASVLLDESLCVWRALKALLTTSLDTTMLVAHG